MYSLSMFNPYFGSSLLLVPFAALLTCH